MSGTGRPVYGELSWRPLFAPVETELTNKHPGDRGQSRGAFSSRSLLLTWQAKVSFFNATLRAGSVVLSHSVPSRHNNYLPWARQESCCLLLQIFHGGIFQLAIPCPLGCCLQYVLQVDSYLRYRRKFCRALPQPGQHCQREAEDPPGASGPVEIRF